MSIGPFVRDDVIYRMVPIGEAEDSTRLGWVPSPALNGTTHGQWSVLMMWMCGCGRPMPLPIGMGMKR